MTHTDYFNEFPAAIEVCDRDGILLYVNDQAAGTVASQRHARHQYSLTATRSPPARSSRKCSHRGRPTSTRSRRPASAS